MRRGSDGKGFDFFRARVMFPIADRLGRTVGFGGRLLPGDDRHPAAQFMYQSGAGERITLYVARNHGDEDSAFRYLSQRGQNLLYWVDGELACALVGALPRERLLNVANRAYHQLETP